MESFLVVTIEVPVYSNSHHLLNPCWYHLYVFIFGQDKESYPCTRNNTRLIRINAPWCIQRPHQPPRSNAKIPNNFFSDRCLRRCACQTDKPRKHQTASPGAHQPQITPRKHKNRLHGARQAKNSSASTKRHPLVLAGRKVSQATPILKLQR